jgi:hypothetical protein
VRGDASARRPLFGRSATSAANTGRSRNSTGRNRDPGTDKAAVDRRNLEVDPHSPAVAGLAGPRNQEAAARREVARRAEDHRVGRPERGP